MKKIVKIILAIIILVGLSMFFIIDNQKCILDVETISSEGYELIQIDQNNYEIVFFGELGRLEQIITLDKNNKIKTIKETQFQYNMPFHLPGSMVESENVKFFDGNNITKVENFEILNNIFTLCNKGL